MTEGDTRQQIDLGISTTAEEVRNDAKLFEKAPRLMAPDWWINSHQLVDGIDGYESVMLHFRFRELILKHLENYARLLATCKEE